MPGRDQNDGRVDADPAGAPKGREAADEANVKALVWRRHLRLGRKPSPCP